MKPHVPYARRLAAVQMCIAAFPPDRLAPSAFEGSLLMVKVSVSRVGQIAAGAQMLQLVLNVRTAGIFHPMVCAWSRRIAITCLGITDLALNGMRAYTTWGTRSSLWKGLFYLRMEGSV
jgi:hypothetical protein